MNWAFLFLAYGDEHIREFNIVGKSILERNPQFKIVIGTDEPNKLIEGLYKVIHIHEPFNFNLKRVVIQEAINEFNTIIYLDTDVHIRDSVDFSILEKLPNGIHPLWIMDENQLSNRDGSFEYIQNYLDKLHDITPGPIRLILEYAFIIKDNDIRLLEFIEHWKRIDMETREVQHQQYGLRGASEGLIIWIAAIASGMIVHPPEGEASKLFDNIVHFGYENQKGIRTTI